MLIRNSNFDDIPRLIEIFNEARDIMRSNGNLNQWSEHYPGADILKKDIADKVGYIIEDNGVTVGYFAFIHGIDQTYLNIYDGKWLEDSLPYAVIHRLAGTKTGHGIAARCFEWCWSHVQNLRIDTHADNTIMQHCIIKAGFQYCGVIHLENGDARLAYQKIIPQAL